MEDLIRQIENRYKQHDQNRPFIIALDGLSGSGKTTLVHQLKSNFDNTLIIHIDDHVVENTKRYNTGHEEWFEYYHLQWDPIYLRDNLFKKLNNNHSDIHLMFYEREKDTLKNKSIELTSKSIVIVEGIFLLRKEWKDFYDYIVFLDCPQEIRHERALDRDAYIGSFEERLRKYKERYWIAEDYYMDTEKPMKQAHYILRYKDIKI